MNTIHTLLVRLGRLGCLGFLTVSAAAQEAGFTATDFRVDENGSAVQSVPIVVAPGTHGVQPDLALTYGSQAGNGLLGLGGNLRGLSAIARVPATRAQDGVTDGIDFDGLDRFVLDGERLRAVEGVCGADGAQYRTEQESFTKVVSYGSAGGGPLKFRAWTRDGRILEFGFTADSRVAASGRSSVLYWLLNKVTDRHGNYYTVTYAGNAAYSEAYPLRIDYTGNAAADLAPYASVRFEYESRSDRLDSFVHGSRVRLTRRLKRVRSYVDTSVVRTYTLTYQERGAARFSQLVSIRESGSDGRHLEPVRFEWSQLPETGRFSIRAPFPNNGYAVNANSYRYLTGDFNGDGRTDLVHLASSRYLRVWLSDGDGTFTIRAPFPNTGYLLSANSYRFLTGDFDGDGRTDLVHLANGRYVHVWLSNGDGTFAIRQPFPNSGYLVSANSYRFLTGDFNGDGRSDLVHLAHGRAVHVWLSNGDGTFSIRQPFPNAGYLVSANNYRFIAGDFNGDRMTDLVHLAGNSYVHVWLSNGDGTFAIRSPYRPWSTYAISANSYRFQAGDFNGDGQTDLVHIAGSRALHVWLSKGDGTFAVGPAFPNSGYGLAANNYRFRVQDFNGDGLTDLVHLVDNRIVHVWYSRGDGTFAIKAGFPNTGYGVAANHYRYLFGDFDGNGRGDLVHLASPRYVHVWMAGGGTAHVTGVTHNRREVRVSYAPLTSASVYTKYAGAAYPKVDFVGAMYVASETRATDGAGGLKRVEYRYEGGRLDLLGRGFRGFARVTKLDHAAGLRHVTEFERDVRCIGANVKRREVRRIRDGGLLASTDNQIAFETSFGGKVSFSYVRNSVERRYELDGSLVSQTTTDKTYDAGFGNLTGVVVGYTGGHVREERYTFFNDAANWVLGRLTKKTITRRRSGRPAATRTTQYRYDARHVLLTKEILEPEGGHALRRETRFVHDAAGNVTGTTVAAHNGTAAEERTTLRVFDARGRFVARTTNALGHVTRSTHDPLHGGVTSTTDANGITVTKTYDGFGRLRSESTPGFGSTTYRYAPVASGLEAYFVEVVRAGRPTTRVHYDLLDRETRRLTRGFDGRWVVERREHDAQGRLARISDRHHGEPRWTVRTFDELDRVVTETAPGGRVTRHAYGGLTIARTNAKGQTLTHVHDVFGNVVSATDDLGHTTTFVYDSRDNLVEIRDRAGNRTAIAYDVFDRKTRIDDPDTGVTSYAFNGFGEQVRETNARGQTTSYRYDLLGRKVARTEPEGTSTWQYDVGSKAKGRLFRATGPGGYSETNSFDAFGRLSATTYAGPGGSFAFTNGYDGAGRVTELRYPTGLRVQRVYNAHGYLAEVENGADGTSYWRVDARNARNQITQERRGNGLVTTYGYDDDQGTVERIHTQGVQDLHFAFDALNNLVRRRDAARGLSETFGYDRLNRLTSTAVDGGAATAIRYDAIGNVTFRSDVGTYAYGAGPAGPHAVTAVRDAHGNVVKSFVYDASGNAVTNHDITAVFTSFNKPRRLSSSGFRVEVDYGPGRTRRVRRLFRNQQLAEVRHFLEGLFEKVVGPQSTRHVHYIRAGGRTVAVHTTGADAGLRYLHHDHLGSLQTVTDASGAVVETLSFDAWGQRRGAADWVVDARLASAVKRGFTGHQHVDRLVDMGGRYYDPTIGRFLSPDPLVAPDGTGQSLNRYAYVLNNPLSVVDPSGFFVKKVFRSVRRFLRKRPVVAAVAGAVTGGFSLALTGLSGLSGLSVGSAVALGSAAGFGTSFAGAIRNGRSLEAVFRSGVKGAVTRAVFGGRSGDARSLSRRALGRLVAKRARRLLGRHVGDNVYEVLADAAEQHVAIEGRGVPLDAARVAGRLADPTRGFVRDTDESAGGGRLGRLLRDTQLARFARNASGLREIAAHSRGAITQSHDFDILAKDGVNLAGANVTFVGAAVLHGVARGGAGVLLTRRRR